MPSPPPQPLRFRGTEAFDIFSAAEVSQLAPRGIFAWGEAGGYETKPEDAVSFIRYVSETRRSYSASARFDLITSC